MLRSLKNMFKVADLRNKILFTLAMILLYRVGSHIPVPGIDFDAVKALREESQQGGGVLGFLSIFSGGALGRMAVFALGIMPYITASIIIQLLQVVIPKLEQIRQRQDGQKKITQITRYVTIGIALVHSAGLTFAMNGNASGFFGQSGGEPVDLIATFTPARVSLIILTLTCGTALVMWMGELVTQRGIGQGMSIIIFANVVAELPSQGGLLYREAEIAKFGAIIGLSIVMLIAIVLMELGQRRIPVQYPKRIVGRRMYAGDKIYIPLKVNQSGVIPIIFASSVLYLPVMLSSLLPDGMRQWIDSNLTRETSIFYIVIYGSMIVMFAYFYTAISFDPHQQTKHIRDAGGFIPGIRPGPATEQHLQHILNRIVLPGALFIAFIALLPGFALSWFAVQRYPFAGTTLLIAVGVALETMKQIDSQLTMRNYEGFLK